MPGTCTRCMKSVIHAEEIQAVGKIWHTNCFLCANCNKRLDSINVTHKDGEAFCKLCYANLFGPKGYGYAMGAAGSFSVSDTLNSSSQISTPRNISTLTNRLHDSYVSETKQGTTKYTPYLAQSRYSSSSKGRAKSPSARVNKISIPAYKANYRFESFRYGDDICGRCQKKVYVTENVSGAGTEKPWHQSCFKCKKCDKRLDSISVQTYEGEVYCVACSNHYHSSRKKY
jgi:cysteine/glycine-rich protein